MGGPNQDTLEMTEEFQQTSQPTQLGKLNDRGRSRKSNFKEIECEHTDQKYMMLKRSKALARQESTHDAYIGPNLTRKEKLANKGLRAELKARRARGKENFLIRRNEIVTAPLLLMAPPLPRL